MSLFFPLMSIALVPNMIRNYVIATNVEMMKDREIVTHVMQVLLCCCGAEMIAISLPKSGPPMLLRDGGFQHDGSTMNVCFVIDAEECSTISVCFVILAEENLQCKVSKSAMSVCFVVVSEVCALQHCLHGDRVLAQPKGRASQFCHALMIIEATLCALGVIATRFNILCKELRDGEILTRSECVKFA